ncbi:MAG TPA: protease inhibitor I9 family protein [Thermoanaerobaculia bacterium]|nr:protease inhibitor I9 family protein [Thermoanaerobaculia bacterium]
MLGSFDPRAPGYIVVLVDGKDLEASVATLAARHGFQVEGVYAVIHGFSAHLEPETVAALRCEPQVSYIEHNQIFQAF